MRVEIRIAADGVFVLRSYDAVKSLASQRFIERGERFQSSANQQVDVFDGVINFLQQLNIRFRNDGQEMIEGFKVRIQSTFSSYLEERWKSVIATWNLSFKKMQTVKFVVKPRWMSIEITSSPNPFWSFSNLLYNCKGSWKVKKFF